MSGRANAEVSAARWHVIWRQHQEGASQRAIAREIGISLKTVQYYLSKGRPDGVPDGLIRRSNQPVDRQIDRRRRPSPAANVIPLRRTS